MAKEPRQSHQSTPKSNEQQLLTLLQEISLAVAQADNIDTAFADVLAYICRFAGWPIGHIYLWSEVAHAFVSSRIWYTENPAANEPLRKMSEAAQFRHGEGTIGRVWDSGEAIIILDVAQENNFVRQLPINQGGICAYFAFPILIEGNVVAILEFLSPQSLAPDQGITSIINHVSALLGLAMQRQQTLTRLRLSEAQLAEAQRTAKVGHWEWDVVHNDVTWSAELNNIFGFSPDNFNLTYEGFLDQIHPDDRAYVEEQVGDAYQNGRSFDYFHRIVRPDGAERVIHARGRPVYDQAGTIVRLNGTAQDMTEQKEAELKLAQTVRQLSALMEIGQAVTGTLDLDVLYTQVLQLIRPLIGAQALLLFLHKQGTLEIVALDQENSTDAHGLSLSLLSDIVGEVWRNQQPLLLHEADCSWRLSPDHHRFTGFQPKTLIAVPLLLHEETLGVLEGAHPEANAFNEADLRLLEIAAVWTAIAIGNARQYKKLQRRLSESDAISAINQAITGTLEISEILKLIASHVQNIVPNADWTTIHLLNPKSNQLELAVSTGLEVNADAYVINLGEGIAGYVMENGGIVNVADVQNDPRRLPIDLRTNARSLLVVPLESRRARIGTISVHCATPSIFTQDDERLLTNVGVQVGMVIENARLYRVQRQARKAAEKRRERMRDMAQHVVEAQEKERARIARELHDESGQSLTSLKISLDMIRAQLPNDMVAIKESLQNVLDLTDKTMNNLRLLSHNLRPPGLDAYGLNAALEGLCHDFETHTPVKVSYTGVDIPDLAALPALSLYRFAQESLTNIAKHAKATEVQVNLEQDSDHILLEVKDNGKGFVPPDLDALIPADGAGLLGMNERLEMVDGRLLIESTLGKGSLLTAFVPYTREGA
jgi:PAS domain S-box-containing protein